ncbi:DUF2169 family type VI secretion system accessory protein [Bordetella petrii]|uniref:DUF2169 family type VI secretion system accessory protein n=1 Tax=Bordetella petrii TaxID=94624 RepID=UPI001E34DC93|nr:DUF2169 domain-containing protein [Bordetella petrii]MCD0501505.1 DUF2169 domain-containing protein [Bordetella petrii]
MKIIKPLRLMVMPRPYRWRNGKYLAVTIAALIKHDGDKPSILPEHTLMHDILPELDCDEMIDYVMPKPHPEFLLSGHAYTAHQEDKTKCMVSVQVGDKKKEGIVFGDRYWNGDVITAPQPFESKPLTWDNSFGGTGFAANPLGTGIDEIEVAGIRAVRLPNLESPIDRVHAKRQRVEPFNFGQIRIDWPQRLEKMGSCDETWVQNVGTGFFDDMQPSVFNAAAEDQIWKNKEALSLDESFEIWNMHPDMHCWSGQLPQVKARCFIRRRHADVLLDEVPMRPTTVWFLPHRASYILLFHGQIAIQEDDAFDVMAIMAAMEGADAPRPIVHYEDVFKTRTNTEKAAFHVLKDEELMPAGMLAPWIEGMALDQHAMLSKLTSMIDERRGFPDGEFVGPIRPMTLADLPTLFEEGEKMTADALEEHERTRQDVLAEAATDDKPLTRRQQVLKELYRDLDFNAQPGDVKKIPVSGPPKLDSLRQVIQSARERRSLREMLKESPQEAATLGQTADFTRRSFGKLYLYSVHYQQGAPRVGEHRAIELRNRILKKYRLGKNLAKMDLTGADLSGMDLSEADFSGAWLENVDFSDTNLSGAIFDQTVLARGTFHRTNLDRATLRDCNISEAVFNNASLCDVEMQSLICETKTTFHDCRLERGHWKRFDFKKAEFINCELTDMKLEKITFSFSTLKQCEIQGGMLEKVTFDDSVIEEVAIRNASIASAICTNTSFTRVEITGCKFGKSTFSEDVSFHDSVLTDNHYIHSMFREVVFKSVDLSGTVFEQCDLSLANFQKCRLQNIRVPQSMCVRVNFDMADLSGSNLMHGIFQKSSFIGANLSGCNFFRADMSETLLDSSTRTDNAYVHRTRLAPFREGVNRTGALRP